MRRKSRVQNGFKRQKCPGPTREQHFYCRKRARRRGIEGANAPKSDSKLTFLKAFCLESFFKNMLPTEGGKHIFGTNMKNSDAKQECNQKCMLQLAFLMQIDVASRFPPRQLEAARLRGSEASRLSDLQIRLTKNVFLQ